MKKALAIQEEVQKTLSAIIVIWTQKYVRIARPKKILQNFIKRMVVVVSNHSVRCVALGKPMPQNLPGKQKTQLPIKSIIIKLINASIVSLAFAGTRAFIIYIESGKIGMIISYLNRMGYVPYVEVLQKRTSTCISTMITHITAASARGAQNVLGGYCAKNATAVSGRSMTIQGGY